MTFLEGVSLLTFIDAPPTTPETAKAKSDESDL